MITGLESKLFHTFIAVCEEGNITKASEKLGYVQSTVSSHISALENIFNKKLFDREPRGVLVTEAGEQLLKYAYEYIEFENELMHSMNSVETCKGTVNIAAIETFCAYRMPKIINDFSKLNPEISFLVKTKGVDDIIIEVLKRKIDFGIIPRNPGIKELDFIPLYKQKLVFLSDADYWDGVEAKQDKEMTYIGFSKSCIFGLIAENAFLKSGIKIINRMEFSNIETIKKLLECKIGVSAIPEENALEEIKNNKLKIVMNNHSYHITYGIVMRKDINNSKAIETALNFFKENIK